MPPPLTITSIPTAGGHGTVVHCLRRHAQLGGRVPPGLGRGQFPRGRASHFILSSTPTVATTTTTHRVEGLGAYRESLSTGKGLREGYGNAFLGFRHGNGSYAQVLALSCYVLTRPKTEIKKKNVRQEKMTKQLKVNNVWAQMNIRVLIITKQSIEHMFHIILLVMSFLSGQKALVWV